MSHEDVSLHNLLSYPLESRTSLNRFCPRTLIFGSCSAHPWTSSNLDPDLRLCHFEELMSLLLCNLRFKHALLPPACVYAYNINAAWSHVFLLSCLLGRFKQPPLPYLVTPSSRPLWSFLMVLYDIHMHLLPRILFPDVWLLPTIKGNMGRDHSSSRTHCN